MGASNVAVWEPRDGSDTLPRSLGRVAEWQTRWLQVPVSFGTWGFKSPFAHKTAVRLNRIDKGHELERVRDPFLWGDFRRLPGFCRPIPVIVEAHPFDAGSVSDRRSYGACRQVTRRKIFDTITLSKVFREGRLEEPDFLARIYDLDTMPSTDSRYRTAPGDIWKSGQQPRRLARRLGAYR